MRSLSSSCPSRWSRQVAGTASVMVVLGAAALAPSHAAAVTTLSAAGSGARVVGSIQVAGYPAGIAANSRTDTVYVGNAVTYRVAVLDGAAHSVVTHVGPFDCCGLTPAVVAVNQSTNTMYAANIDDNHLYATRGRAPHYRASPALPIEPESIAVNRRTNTVYLTDSYTPQVVALDGRTLRVRATIALPNDSSGAVAIDAETGRLYVADGIDVDVINGRTGRLVDTIPSAASSDLAVDSRTDTVYAADAFGQGGSVTVIDGHTDTVTTTIPVSGARSLAVDGADDTLLVGGTNGVSLVDTHRNRVLGTVSVPTGSHVVAVARNHAYVSFQHGVKIIGDLRR
jgi:DNA-binding beta-propeller fold protein YncE